MCVGQTFSQTIPSPLKRPVGKPGSDSGCSRTHVVGWNLLEICGPATWYIQGAICDCAVTGPLIGARNATRVAKSDSIR